MAVNRGYVPNHKFYDDMGRITPNVDWSESHRPHFEAQVASWLPVLRYEEEVKGWFVVSSGKVVSVDREGNLCLSGYKKAFANGASNVLTYTAEDYAAGTIDLTTGAAYATNGTTQYDTSDLTTALRARGLISASEYPMDFISHPIGYASYNYYQAAGSNVLDPTTYTNHNYKPQELVAVTCDYCCIAPVTPAVATDEAMATDNTGGADGALTSNGLGTKGWYNSTQLNDFDRYESLVTAGDDVVAYVTDFFPAATNTNETPISSDVTGGLADEKNAIADIREAGDWYFDHEAGVLFLYEAGGDAIPTGWTTSSALTYYHYASVVEAARVSSYFCATGDIKLGDYLTYDSNSNLIKATLDIGTTIGYNAGGTAFSADPEYDTESDNAVVSTQLEQAVTHYHQGIVGQVLNEIVYPRGYLDKVRTAYAGSPTTPNALTGIPTVASMQTPGSATGGRTDQLSYTNSAEKLLIVNWLR